MRIVIDLQGAQSSGSRNRGIGRYTEALALSICKQSNGNEIHLVLNNAFAQTIDPIKALFEPELHSDNIHVFDVFTPTDGLNSCNDVRRKTNEAMREAFIGRLMPDVVLIISLFEGLVDDSVTSVKTFNNLPTVVLLHDLIPLIHREIYLKDSKVENWYFNKLDHLKRADLLLTNSQSTAQEAIDCLSFDIKDVVNISTGSNSQFRPIKLTEDDNINLANKYSISKSFVMYTGGIDHRKNIEGLIRSYAALPYNILKQHQLVIVCSVNDVDRERLAQLASENGLSRADYIMTGFVTDEDLVRLYNACKLFIFPSWHEGFGLPALEAMQCGRPVIAANTSSLPEVIGNPEALFDPWDDAAITAKILDVLTSPSLRKRLIKHGLKQSKNFNWHDIAKRAIESIEDRFGGSEINARSLQKRPRLAYVSPLPPVRSGISDYSVELIEELTRWYQIDVIVAQSDVATPWINANCGIHTVEWFKENSDHFDRVMYHFGNSEFHQHMFDLLDKIPGIVVLHDFYLSGVQSYRSAMMPPHNVWKESLYHSHGYNAVLHSENEEFPYQSVWAYPANLKVIQDALGVVVHSNYAISMAEEWYGSQIKHNWHKIPLLKSFPLVNNKTQARVKLGIDKDAVLICSFGRVQNTKKIYEIVEAFLDSTLAQDMNCYLVFVGQNDENEYGAKINKLIGQCSIKDRIIITGWADSEEYKLYLQAADIGIQLRTLSRGETSAAILDCMNYGLATIANANGSMGELDPESIYLLADEFERLDLIKALESLYKHKSLLNQISANATEQVRKIHSPRYCARLYSDVIEREYEKQRNGLLGLVKEIRMGSISLDIGNPDSLRKLANNFPISNTLKQIFVDVSILSITDARTGIQRVVRSILRELIESPPLGYRIEPVFATLGRTGYWYARQFTCDFLGIEGKAWAIDQEIEYTNGDIFLGLDLHPDIAIQQRSYLAELRSKGVKVSYVVYDLLPILQSQYFDDECYDLHTNWLNTIQFADELICISKSVADETEDWLNNLGVDRERPLSIDWFHLGADIDNSLPNFGKPKNIEKTLGTLRARPTFLMVGTLEPRKGHRQVLEAFSTLWANRNNINLVFVGKRGWLVDDLIEKLEFHNEYRKRLFWLESISDEYLETIYSASSCLIAASYGEGFGLPLIEAAQHRIPIIARDIPVFREVAENNAFYFENNSDPDVITKAVTKWLSLYKLGQHSNSEKLSWLTWKQSTQQLLDILLNRKSTYLKWQHNKNIQLWGDDLRLRSQVGERANKTIKSNGEVGLLFYGPYMPLKKGLYVVEVYGSQQRTNGKEFFDMTHSQGEFQFFKEFLTSVKDNSKHCIIRREFELKEDISDVEFRLYINCETQLIFSSLVIKSLKVKPMQEVGINASLDKVNMALKPSTIKKSSTKIGSPLSKE